MPKDFPKYENAIKIPDKADRLDFLQRAVIEDLQTEKQREFPNLLPYIQLHEFEALVFSSIDAIGALYSDEDAKFSKLERIILEYASPEDINDGLETTPSRRLKNLIRGYNKVNDGTMIIEEAGIDTVLEKCPRFRSWVGTLVEKVKE